MEATYTKLKSGAWGVRVKGARPQENHQVTVKKKSGDTKRETIDTVLWSSEDGQVHLCAIRARNACEICGHSHGWAPCGYPGCERGYCDECDGGGRYCRG